MTQEDPTLGESVPSDALEDDTGPYEVDVQEASKTLGVSLARLSQLTTRGTLSHVRKRVGARWRIYYRRDEITDLSRVHRAVVYQRPAGFVPLPLPPHSAAATDRQAEARAGASSLPSEASFEVAHTPRQAESSSSLLAPPASVSLPSHCAGIGYGSNLRSATSLRDDAEVPIVLGRVEAAIASLERRLCALESGLTEQDAQVRALRLNLPLPGRQTALAPALGLAATAAVLVEQGAATTLPTLPTLPPKRRTRRTVRAPRVRYDKGARH